MKKFTSFVIIFLFAARLCTAQLSQGGIPLGASAAAQDHPVPVHTFKAPDYEAAVKVYEATELKEGISRPYLVALGTATDISFPASGSFSAGIGNHLVWRADIQIGGAAGIGLCYDRFQLPAGVRYFLSNGNGQQILGAYTQSNNRPSGLFAHEPVQGDIIRLELDIDPEVKPEDIQLHCNKAAVYFRSVEYLQAYSRDEGNPVLLNYYDSVTLGGSSVCMIDAECPTGVRYFNQNRATLSIIVPDTTNTTFGWCSATMMNVAGNTAANCKNYLLTASHCDYSQSMDKTRFDQMLLRFNYQQPSCNARTYPEANTLTGAEVLARSEMDEVNHTIKGDFLLLQPYEAIPESWHVNLAGWNRDSNVVRTATAPKKFISFHHPVGDVKKLSAGHQITSDHFSETVTEETHWATSFDSGYVSPGSSGAALFNGEGYVIGSLTGSKHQAQRNECILGAFGDTAHTILGTDGWYSKLAYNWSNNSAITRKLQPWLDPAMSGVLQLEGLKSACASMDTINTLSISKQTLEQDIQVYPNPVAGADVHIRFNLSDIADISVSLIDISGRTLQSFLLRNVRNGTYTLPVATLPSGMYLLRMSDGHAVTGKKIMIRH